MPVKATGKDKQMVNRESAQDAVVLCAKLRAPVSNTSLGVLQE